MKRPKKVLLTKWKWYIQCGLSNILALYEKVTVISLENGSMFGRISLIGYLS